MHHQTITRTVIFLYQLWWIVGHILGSIHTHTLTLRLHPILAFPRRSGGFVPVTHAARECTAFGDLQSLAKSRWFRVRHLSRDLRRNLAGRWWRQWWRLESSGKKRKEDAWGIGRLQDNDNRYKIRCMIFLFNIWSSFPLKCFSVITFWETSSPLYAQPLEFGIFLICAWECRALVSRSIVSGSQSPCHVSILSCISCISLVE